MPCYAPYGLAPADGPFHDFAFCPIPSAEAPAQPGQSE
jgi:hypothetical protein